MTRRFIMLSPESEEDWEPDIQHLSLDKERRIPLVQGRRLSKRLQGGGVLSEVSVALRTSEIHLLLGKDPVARATLVRILSKTEQPDQGDVIWAGSSAPGNAGHDDAASKVRLVDGVSSLVPSLTLLGNWALRHSRFWVNRRLRKEMQLAAENLGLELLPGRLVSACTPGERQRFELFLAFSAGCRAFILYEPLSRLSHGEAEALARLMRQVRSQGGGFLLHDDILREELAFADRISVLRGGVLAGRVSPEELQAPKRGNVVKRVRAWLGETNPKTNGFSAENREIQPRRTHEKGILEIDRGSACLEGVELRDVSFVLRQGEVLGVAALDRRELEILCFVAAGIVQVENGRIRCGGSRHWLFGARAARELRAISRFLLPASAPDALAWELSVGENLLLRLASRPGLRVGPFFRKRRAWSLARGLLKSIGCGHLELENAVRDLPAAQCAKLLWARDLSFSPALIVALEPEDGLGIELAAALHRRLARLAEAGAAILFASTNPEFLLELSHRVAVLRNGRWQLAEPAGGAEDLRRLIRAPDGCVRGIDSEC